MFLHRSIIFGATVLAALAQFISFATLYKYPDKKKHVWQWKIK